MALRCVRELVMVVTAFLLAICTASPNRSWQPGDDDNPPPSRTPKTFIVGGSAKWTYGVNYTDWAIKHSPFYQNDTLVFRYPAPAAKNNISESVYLFDPWDYYSFANCDIGSAFMLASPTDGEGKGFEFKLTYPYSEYMPALFGSGEGNGTHCSAGMMRFAVWPLLGSA
ncbi:uncharacterized protein LOC131155856 [Malania oleifera]|uniref:uncharacterized protein LOC131155856 n=1 Tax=Malania oleifera TaxID=397392 RepID=UPI0025AEB0EA|nr:uncharacterized protein LOC131155856 [Malania oleifera]